MANNNERLWWHRHSEECLRLPSPRCICETVKYVLACGSAFDGVVLYGPFDTYDEALKHGEADTTGSDWHVVEVQTPDALFGEEGEDDEKV